MTANVNGIPGESGDEEIPAFPEAALESVKKCDPKLHDNHAKASETGTWLGYVPLRKLPTATSSILSRQRSPMQ